MTKTFKCCTIFFISSLWLVLMRMLFSLLNLSDNISSWLFSILVQVIGMGLIPMLLYKFWVKEDIISGFSIKTKLPKSIYIIAVVLGFLLSYMTTGVSLLWQNLIALLGYTHTNNVGTIYSGVEVLIMQLICTAVLPAIFEELTDRGLALQMFKDIEDERMTIILIGILFGLLHQNIVQTGYAFVGGLVFAYLLIKTKSIIPGIIIHFINNAISVINEYSSQRNGGFARLQSYLYKFINDHFLLALISWIAAAALIVWLLKIVKSKSTTIVTDENDSFNYSPKKIEYIDDLFGVTIRRNISIKSRAAWQEYAFLYATVAMTLATTLFTFIWGVWR